MEFWYSETDSTLFLYVISLFFCDFFLLGCILSQLYCRNVAKRLAQQAFETGYKLGRAVGMQPRAGNGRFRRGGR